MTRDKQDQKDLRVDVSNRGMSRRPAPEWGMRISRLLLHDFRGWAALDLRPRGHVLLAGVPRAGRSDIIAAVSRVLDPASFRGQPLLSDIRQTASSLPAIPTEGNAGVPPGDGATSDATADRGPGQPEDAGSGASESGAAPVSAEYAQVEVTLIDLDAEVEQLCDGFLEPQDSNGQASDASDADPDALWCVRLAYRVTYDPIIDSVEHVLFYPARSDPPTGQYQRVPTAVRRALAVVALNSGRPLQLRAEGTLRRLVTERDPNQAAAAFQGLASVIRDATAGLSTHPTIATTVDAILSTGSVGRRLGDGEITAADVRFQAEDGSLSALLRAVQPALHLDNAGLLSLPGHGSTATAILSTAEALVLASVPGAIVIGDDFGDQLDAATTEHFAAVLRARAAQLWLSTRRPETARAFEPHELVRLTRHGGDRKHHVLERITDRKTLTAMRLLHTQLLPALTAPTVAITEGPHDLTAYSAVDRRRGPVTPPLSAHGVRLLSADSGSGGGTSQIPRVAALARQLGFRVVALIDCDPAKTTSSLSDIQTTCDVVVRLPTGMALEEALMAGIDPSHLRTAAATLTEYGLPDPTIGKADGDVGHSLIKPLHKQGLHDPFLEALIPEAGLPPTLTAALESVAAAAAAEYSGPALVDVPPPQPSTAPGPPP